MKMSKSKQGNVELSDIFKDMQFFKLKCVCSNYSLMEKGEKRVNRALRNC